MSKSSACESLQDNEQPKIKTSTSHPVVRDRLADMELMKERFSKMLLGEDMSGGGKGVSSALALSNSITNLAASVFGEQRRLEPMVPETKTRWRKEIDWLLSVTDHIVEFAPMKQTSKDGTTMEIMTTRQRSDLRMNVPALRKLDAMLLDCLDNFKGQTIFYYPSKHDEESQKGTPPTRQDDKWWIPKPKVPSNGLSDAGRSWLLNQKDAATQVLKAAMAINAQTLTEMEIPESYIESLPKSGRAILGETMYRYITEEYFDPDYFLTSIDLSSEHKIVDLKNKLEGLVVIWTRKLHCKDTRSSWGSGVSAEKREIFEERAELILQMLKQKFPGLPQSDLEISKIQFNQDVGLAILESYSRIIESLAHTVLSRIEDVMHADTYAKTPSIEHRRFSFKRPSFVKPPQRVQSVTEDDSSHTPTLFDMMGWNTNDQDNEMETDLQDEDDPKQLNKFSNIVTDNKVSYTERVESLGGLRSPTARH
ncbi:rho guanine nucleotide exchange factor 8-like [Andrographis paniculata]|uniref:rho guanine nucleotide exchange factor 8-like n=1 Tax=Andrographis paniculata TaxID=175694 RepID=UPI0021E80911|nr:rho guanine nucleotide exchange factor 8-like [Andrographis paniculata]